MVRPILSIFENHSLRPTSTSRRRSNPTVLPLRSAEELRQSLRNQRLLDLGLSVLISIVSLPVVAICAAIVRLTSSGPAFYSQQRVGQFGQVYTIYKLRTMYLNCEKASGPQWSTPGDPRVTWFGKILRASHLDELPQLVNVFRGEMSLVGPRPERPEIAAKLGREIENYDCRSAVLPGITGHAQVHLPPDTTIEDVMIKIRLDRQYLASWGAPFALLTLLRTGLKVLGLYRPIKEHRPQFVPVSEK
jgi:lipopolysaccharide/colanic/teichoic acid biosynthesis glycosyltransferase